jgi:hypothetical protein
MAAENMADILAYELIFGADERPQFYFFKEISRDEKVSVTLQMN